MLLYIVRYVCSRVRPHDTPESGECPAIVGMLLDVPCVGINAMMLCK